MVDQVGTPSAAVRQPDREELVRQRLRGAARPPEPITKFDRERPAPLSTGQQQMWLLHRLDPTSPAYLMSWALRLAGGLDTAALRWAWDQVISRHEILRTRYAAAGDEPIQVIDPADGGRWREIDLTAVPSEDREEAARRLVDEQRRQPISLAEDPPVRVTLVRIEPECHLLIIVIHHIACDAASYRVLATELGSLYRTRVGGQPPALPAVGLQFADYAGWERGRVNSGALRKHLDYWRDRLAGSTPLALPLDRRRPSRPDWRGGAVAVPVSAGTAERVRELASAHRASSYIVLLAAYHASLSAFSGQTDVAVGTPVSIRTRPELADLVGYLVNSVVVRARCAGDASFASLLAEVRERALEAMDFREAPFPWVVEQLRPARGVATNPLFQVAFDLNESDEGTFSLPGVAVSHLRHDSWPVAKFDLTLHIEQTEGGLTAGLEYATAVIDERTAEHFAATYAGVLDAVSRNPEVSLSELWQRFPPRQVPAAARAGAESGGQSEGEDRATDPGADAPLRSRLRQAWQEALHTDQVGPDDNFFDLGGDSLRAVALAGRLSGQGLAVSAVDIFAHQTVAELASVLSGRAPASEIPAGVRPFAMVSPDDREALPPDVVDAYPVGVAQLGMIVEMRSTAAASRYQDTTSFRIRDGRSLDPTALRAAAQLVVDRHEVLRTSFDLSSYSVPLQLVHRRAEIHVGVTEHSGVEVAGWKPRLEAYAAEQRRLPQDLSQAPLIRIHAHTADDSPDWWLSVTECHAILEGWSFHSLLMEILSQYRELRAGRPAAVPEPVPFRFADHIAAERAALRSDADRGYWRDVVTGRSPVSLPSGWQGDRDAPDERYQAMVAFIDLEDALRRLASATGTSLKAVLLAAHLTVLRAIVGRDDFYAGLVCDARPEIAGADRVPGMFLNTVPFALPGPARTWGELVTAVFESLTTMWPHRRFPMQVVQQEFGQGARLIDIMFNYLDFHQVDKELVEWEATIDETDNEFALHVFTLSGHVKLNTTTHALSRAAADRLAAMYRAVLEQMAAGPEGAATALCLPAGEAEQIRAWGAGRELTERPETVPGWFADRVADQPDAPAVIHGRGQLSYRELDVEVEHLAHRLREGGVSRGRLVGVAPQTGPGAPVALLAVWRVGAVWLPLDPTSAAGSLRRQAEQAGAVALLVSPDRDPAEIGPGHVPVVAVTVDGPDPVAGPVAGQRLPEPWELACVLPAGQAGREAISVPHGAVARAVLSLRAGLADAGAAATSVSVWWHRTPLTSSAALTEVLVPLTTGGRILTSDAADGDPVSTPPAGCALTHLQATPLVAERLAGEPAAAPATMIVGGDPAIDPGTTPVRTAGQVLPGGAVSGLPGWVGLAGTPAPGVVVRILDSRLRPVPVGVRGELCLGGEAMGAGDAGDPASTAERFVPDPLGVRGERLYRSGQLGRFRVDGRLEWLGPIARQTTPAGELLDLSQVRAELDRQPTVRDSQVVLADDWSGARTLVGYVRAAPGGSCDPMTLRRTLAERLPRSLVPETVVLVDSWPLNPRGEIDVDRLPRPDAAAVQVPAETLWDKEFEDLLRSVLPFLPDDEELAPDLELISAGLNSLSTVELLVAVEHTYDIVIPDGRLTLDMFETPRTLWQEIARLRADQEAGGPGGGA